MPNYCNKKCHDCDKDFIATNGFTKYCQECRGLKSICPECGGHKKDIYTITCSSRCGGIKKWREGNQKKEYKAKRFINGNPICADCGEVFSKNDIKSNPPPRCLKCRCLKANKYYAENKEQIKQTDGYKKSRKKHRQYASDWRKKNRAEQNAYFAEYNLSKKNRMPSYADKKAIARKYRTAQIMSSFGKTKYHVDHIVPLQGQLVSGFHHEDNLQILTAKDNHEKSNKFIPYVEIFKNNKITKEYIQC
jgi:hypothetical protein